MIELGVTALLAVLLAAENAETGIPYFAPGVTVLGTAAALYMLWRFQRSIVQPLEHRADSTDSRLKAESKQRETCEWRLRQLVTWLRDEEGMAVPDRILYGSPPISGVEG